MWWILRSDNTSAMGINRQPSMYTGTRCKLQSFGLGGDCEEGNPNMIAPEHKQDHSEREAGHTGLPDDILPRLNFMGDFKAGQDALAACAGA
jgi:hypothetical protein